MTAEQRSHPADIINGEALLRRYGDKVANFKGRLAVDADMSKVAWFRAGGKAELFYQPSDVADLQYFLRETPKDINLTIVGFGSNLLIRDGGLRGVTLRLPTKDFGDVKQISPTRLEVGCGISDKKLAAAALEAGIGGFHFFNGIPGSLGGALRMNAGANQVETRERVIEVRALDRGGNIHVLRNADMGFSYRHSEVGKELIFVSAIMEGYLSNKEEIRAAMAKVVQHREDAQPIREKTGGSTFRNPGHYSAWKLIDEAGCRGLTIGGAKMSEMHCNFMINTGNATAYDLELLGETVRQKVYANCGVLLVWEIKRLGEFLPGRIVDPFTVNCGLS